MQLLNRTLLTVTCFMNDYTQVAAGSDRPEVFVFCAINPMKVQPWIGRVQLQVKRSGLDGLLFIAGQFGEAVSKCIRYSKLHIVNLI